MQKAFDVHHAGEASAWGMFWRWVASRSVRAVKIGVGTCCAAAPARRPAARLPGAAGQRAWRKPQGDAQKPSRTAEKQESAAGRTPRFDRKGPKMARFGTSSPGGGKTRRGAPQPHTTNEGRHGPTTKKRRHAQCDKKAQSNSNYTRPQGPDETRQNVERTNSSRPKEGPASNAVMPYWVSQLGALPGD